MTAHRTATAAAVAVAAPLLLLTWAVAAAQAHGAPTDPVSRAAACSPEGGSNTGTAACRAAIAANGAPFTAWDNLRVADVGGRDRQVIPDGQLCSGGLPAYKGLNLARADWPSTDHAGRDLHTLLQFDDSAHGDLQVYLVQARVRPDQASHVVRSADETVRHRHRSGAGERRLPDQGHTALDRTGRRCRHHRQTRVRATRCLVLGRGLPGCAAAGRRAV